LNNSGVVGQADVRVDGRQLDISVDARGPLRNMPHAMHIHFSAHSRGTCPTVRDDDNDDHRLNTTEGQPAYGSVRVSLTKDGPTGPASALAVNRFPTAPRGQIHYERETTTSHAVAEGIRSGNAAVVIHGIDYNNNDTYDFSARKSDLDPALPTEATDPVSCGVLRQSQCCCPICRICRPCASDATQPVMSRLSAPRRTARGADSGLRQGRSPTASPTVRCALTWHSFP
jgi:hypothetical protein